MSFSEKPLLGQTVLVTRSETQALPFIQAIETRGGTAVSTPLLTFRMPSKIRGIKRALNQLDEYEWIMFTSQNAVEFFLIILERLRYQVEDIKKHKIAAIGKKTESLLHQYGLPVHFSPTEYVAERFVEEFSVVLQEGERVLFPHGNLARDTIRSGLIEDNKQIDSFVIYETVPDATHKSKIINLLKNDRINIITFSSSSTVHFFFELVGTKLLESSSVQFACIGPITARTLETYGFQAHMIANEYTIDGLVDAIVKKKLEEEIK
ncbi:uroporphyrinogen-III synthase [Pseudalkalibacillus decolorationis]|uniref:uroporphyrinogen-III synthase n=1 Tax=Pseudalkalibacillus decolorationis TaxID=163879 RepID=UPI0021492CF5|nr:uroporphyrinogen-III synthase [Pseudalkalibacillus decolorationis]